MPSIEAAQERVSFEIASVERLDLPGQVFIATDVPLAHRGVVVRFEDPERGVFVVTEDPLARPPNEARVSLEADAKACGDSKCGGNWSLVRLADGSTALLIDGPEDERHRSTSLVYVDEGRNVLVVVMGPPATFSAEEALSVANELRSS